MPSLIDLVLRMGPLLDALHRFLLLVALPLIGAFTFIAAIFIAIRLQQPQRTRPTDSVAKVLTWVAVSALCVHLSDFQSDLWKALTGASGNKSVLFSYRAPVVPEHFKNIIEACLRFVALMGWFWAAKGLLLTKQLADGSNYQGGESLVGKAFVHVLFGFIAININSFLPMLARSAGFSI